MKAVILERSLNTLYMEYLLVAAKYRIKKDKSSALELFYLALNDMDKLCSIF